MFSLPSLFNILHKKTLPHLTETVFETDKDKKLSRNPRPCGLAKQAGCPIYSSFSNTDSATQGKKTQPKPKQKSCPFLYSAN